MTTPFRLAPAERCPYCSFQPTNSNDYCEAHRPVYTQLRVFDQDGPPGKLLGSFDFPPNTVLKNGDTITLVYEVTL